MPRIPWLVWEQGLCDHRMSAGPLLSSLVQRILLSICCVPSTILGTCDKAEKDAVSAFK